MDVFSTRGSDPGPLIAGADGTIGEPGAAGGSSGLFGSGAGGIATLILFRLSESVSAKKLNLLCTYWIVAEKDEREHEHEHECQGGRFPVVESR